MDPTGYCRDGTGVDTGTSYGETPYIGDGSHAGAVRYTGDVYDYVNGVFESSYGKYRRSPVTVSSDSASNVLPSGHVDYDYHNVVPYNSYGHIIAVHG